jgi:nucleotidyltransferase substrate binding protein (TIGR01987 family)
MSEGNETPRWRLRLGHFERAHARLREAVELARQRPLSELEQQGLIQAFEFTHELAWKVLKDYFAYQGVTGITGSRDAVREAFATGLVQDGEGWMDMITSRNLTSHTYNVEVADAIAERILSRYAPLFDALLERLREIGDRDDT